MEFSVHLYTSTGTSKKESTAIRDYFDEIGIRFIRSPLAKKIQVGALFIIKDEELRMLIHCPHQSI
jgi:hypothetical protein